MTCEELYLTGLHIEQYRHATYRPDPYYLEGLKRDPGDIRLNNAYGSLLLRRGQFAQAEGYFRKALERCTWKNPNPYDSEPYYNLGLALFYQGKLGEAFDAFYTAMQQTGSAAVFSGGVTISPNQTPSRNSLQPLHILSDQNSNSFRDPPQGQ